MKKVIISLLVVILYALPSSSFSRDGWLPLYANSELKVYADINNAHATDKNAYVWVFYSIKTDDDIKSAKKYKMIDCEVRRLKTLSTRYYSDEMGTKFISDDDNAGGWEYPSIPLKTKKGGHENY